MSLFLGLLLAGTSSYLAYRARSLSKDGAYAAVFIGTIIFGLGGWQWAVLLLAFFISSSLLTHSFKNRKKDLDEKYSKEGPRDAGQVISNGGIAAFFVVLHALFPEAIWTWLVFASALAAVNSDTWATELGVLNPDPPRLISDLRLQVEKGTSGAISLVGTGAAIMGAAFIGTLAALVYPTGNVSLFFWVTFSGFAGSLLDSFLGATVQAIYYCPLDHKETEKHPYHTCGMPTFQVRGWRWLNNDFVNVACSLCGASLSLFAVLVKH